MNTVKKKSVRREKSLETRLMDLLKYEPRWGSILRACVEESKRTKNDFAGAWVFWHLKEGGVKTPVNLRRLTGVKALRKLRTVRGGKRAYYSIPDIASVERALKMSSF